VKLTSIAIALNINHLLSMLAVQYERSEYAEKTRRGCVVETSLYEGLLRPGRAALYTPLITGCMRLFHAGNTCNRYHYVGRVWWNATALDGQ
jgi:hypothetical protein